MSRNRTIPFGYMMRKGVITANPVEVTAVLKIYSEYMAGKSLKTIAEEMTVPYSEDSTWNKNMVKRVLENHKYLGTDDYPQLIGEDIFKAVNRRKTVKATALCVVPEEMQTVRSLIVCKECGKKLFRNKSELWDCRNGKCHPYYFRLSDEMLTDTILTILNTVIANPTLIEVKSDTGGYIQNSEILCRQGEIDRAIDNESKSFEEIQNDIFCLASMKYSQCQYSDILQKTLFLKTMLSGKSKMSKLYNDFMKSCIKQITVSHSCVIEAEFINGVIIKNETERSNESGHNT